MVARPIAGIIACNRLMGEEIAQVAINRYVAAPIALPIPALANWRD
jgi:hypothetical protein